MAEQSTSSAVAAAIPAMMQMIKDRNSGGDKYGKPQIFNPYTTEQQLLLGKLGDISNLSPQYTDTMRQMMYGGTASDYSPQASADLFNRDIIPHSTEALYGEQLPMINQNLGSSYWSSLRGPEAEKAQSASNLGIMSKYGESVLGNAQTGRSEAEAAREAGLSSLYGMQTTAMNAKPYDLMFMPSTHTPTPAWRKQDTFDPGMGIINLISGRHSRKF